jgi:hypothetical protein
MLWFEGAGSPTGRAAHFPWYYRFAPQGGPAEVIGDACPRTSVPVTARVTLAEPAGFIDDVWGRHTGKRGKHWILDNQGPHPELPSTTCIYDGTDLVAIRVRRPIAFARDTGPGVQRQDIGWRVRLQYTALNSTETDWLPMKASDEVRRRASDVDWSDFRPRTISVPDMLKPFYGVRVVYQLTWYKAGTDVVRGTARHSPRWYVSDAVTAYELPNPYCYASIAS